MNKGFDDKLNRIELSDKDKQNKIYLKLYK
jgi:hypothetical protein